MPRPYLGSARCFILSVALAAGIGGAVASEPLSAIPAMERCALLEFRMMEGWWLQIRKDEPAAYGFGALPQRVSIKKNTFSLEEVYREIIDSVLEHYSKAQVTVSFGPMAPGFEGRVFALEIDATMVSELFARAYRERDQFLDDGFQQEAIRHLDPFWAEAPFLQ